MANGELNLFINENTASVVENFSVDFRNCNIALAFDEVKDCLCISVYNRETGNNRFYDVKGDGSLEYADMMVGDVLEKGVKNEL